MYSYTEWVKSRLTIVDMGNSEIINNTIRINSVLCTHYCKPTFVQPWVFISQMETIWSFIP